MEYELFTTSARLDILSALHYYACCMFLLTLWSCFAVRRVMHVFLLLYARCS